MDKKDLHPSHQMEDDDYGPDLHCTENCKICRYGHCYLCPTDHGMDDAELQAQCIGFPWYDGEWNGDKLVGHKSGTGWPRGKK